MSNGFKMELPRGHVVLDEAEDVDLQELGEQLGVVEPLPEVPEKSDKDKMRDFFFKKNEYPMGPKCTCGQFLVGPGRHSPSCQRHGRED